MTRRKLATGMLLLGMAATSACGLDSTNAEPTTLVRKYAWRQVHFGQWHEGGTTSIAASADLRDERRVYPADVDATHTPWEITSIALGDCVATVLESPVCASACPSGYRCYFDATHEAVCLEDYTVTETSYPAGRITLTGALEAVGLDTDGSGLYTPVNVPGTALFTGGESVTISAPGDATPTFAATMQTPGLIQDLAPSLDGVLTLPATGNLAFTWTGGSGTVQLVMTMDRPPYQAQVLCQVSTDSLGVEVPAAILALPGSVTSPTPLDWDQLWLTEFTSTRADPSGADVFISLENVYHTTVGR